MLMADRRLNTSVVLLGLGAVVVLVLGGVFVFSRLSTDPAPLIAAGDAAWQAKDYEGARQNYGEALNATKDPKGQVELLFKLTEVYKATSDWAKVLACWANIITIDPPNLRARLGQLKYYYIMVDSLGPENGRTAISYWKEVLSQATQLIEIAKKDGVMNQPKAQWEPSLAAAEPAEWSEGTKLLGAHLHLAKGRAALELTRLGAATNPDQSLAEAKADLLKAKEIDSANAEVYMYLTSVLMIEGEVAKSRGNDEQAQDLTAQADKLVTEGIEATGDAPDLHIQVLARKLTGTQRAGAAETRQKTAALEGEYRALTARFPSNPETFAATADFYSLLAVQLPMAAASQKLDLAIEAAKKARALDPNSFNYTVMIAGLEYRKFSIYGDQTALAEAISLVEAALEMPDAQNTPGPKRHAKQMNRLSACTLLGMFYFEQVFGRDGSTLPDEAILAKAERVVHEIEQIQASSENPYVLKWKGLLELARGHTEEAVRILYTAYAQIKAADPDGSGDAFLSYMLAQIFQGSPETGAVIEFLRSALNSGIANSKPETLLDYSEALMRATSYSRALGAVENFQQRFGPNNRSQELRTRMLISMGHVSEAKEAIEAMDSSDPNVVKLNLMLVGAEVAQLQEVIARIPTTEEPSPDMTTKLHQYQEKQVQLAQELLRTGAVTVGEDLFVSLCGTLIEQADPGTARPLAEALVQRYPQNVTALFFQKLLSEPNPSDVSSDRRKEIHLEVIRSLSDPIIRAAELGAYYENQGQLDEAIAQWRKVLEADVPDEKQVGAIKERSSMGGLQQAAAGHLFDIARSRQDWTLGQEVIQIVKDKDLDGCAGHLFAGRLALAQEQYKAALTQLDECLKLRPIFSFGYMVRSNIHAVMGNEQASIEDAQRALSLNPTEPIAAKSLAKALLARDEKLGDSISSEQRAETEAALQRAIGLNPRDADMLIAYANIIGEREPLKALAIRQTIQANAPSFNNAVMLGRLATRMGAKEEDPAKKQTLFSIAESAFQQAKAMDPDNQFLLESYAEYYRVTDQVDKAQALLANSEDPRLLWRHYYRLGRYEKAHKLLAGLYNDGSSKLDALKGLVLVAQTTGDKAAVKKYSEELLSLEDNDINRMAQIRAYLDVGLVQEALPKVQSFKERYPNEPRLILMEALLAKRQGQLDRALTLINQGLTKDQEDAAAWRLRGEIRLLMGDADLAIGDFQRSRLLKDDPLTTVALARALIWAGRDQDAITELQGALQDADSPAAARELLENIYRRLERFDALDRFYGQTLSQMPESVKWILHAGAFAIERSQYEKAIGLYGQACQLRREEISDDSSVRNVVDAQYATALDGYLQALVLSAGKPESGSGNWHPERLEKALQEGQKHVDGPYAAIAFQRMAEAKSLLGETEAAKEYCREAVDKAWDDDRLAMGVLLGIYRLLGPEEVTQYCRQRLQTNPNSLAANFTMYNLARIQNDYAGAIDYIDKCIVLSGAQTEQGLGYTIKKAQTLTAAYKRTSDNAYLFKAIAVYQSLMAKMPTNSSILNNLAYMLAQSGQDLAQAQQYAEKALAEDPDNAGYLDTYAYVLLKNDRASKAAEAIAAAIQHYEAEGPAPVSAYEHLGMVKEALGEKEKALAAYRRAMELGAGVVPEAVNERIRSAIERVQ